MVKLTIVASIKAHPDKIGPVKTERLKLIETIRSEAC